jgi:predicted Zn-dependent peptidase
LCIVAWAQNDDFVQYQLDNGLTVYLWEDHDQPDVQGWTVTRAGSIDEPATATGLAHYLEHMLFKGTDHIGALDWEKEQPLYEQIIALYDTLALTTDAKAREAVQLRINEVSLEAAKYAATDEFSNLIQGIGGEGLNAFTAYDVTCYMNSFPSYQMERWLTLYADRLTNPVFRSFQAELENVFEEYNMYLDDNSTHTRNFIFGKLYEGHAYARDIIGYPEDLKNPKMRQLIDFYNTWYVPNNMALILVGDFDTEAAKPLIEKTFGKLQARPLPQRTQYPTTAFSQDERYSAKLGYMPELYIAYNGVPVGDKDELLLDFLGDILSNSMQIGLLDELTLDNKLMYAGAMNDIRRDQGRFIVVAVPYMDAETQTYTSLKETENLVNEAIQQLVNGNISEELVEAVRQNFYQEFDRTMEYPAMKVQLLQNAFTYQQSIEEMLLQKERVAAITMDDIKRVAKQYLGAPKKVFEIEEGTPKKDKLPKPKIKSLESPKSESAYCQYLKSIPVGKLTPTFIDFSDIDQDLFYEGVSVYCTPNTKNHIFSLRLKYGVGTYELPLMEYAASLMNMAGIKGAPGIKPAEFRANLAKLGGKCSYAVSEDYFYVDIEGNEENLEKIVEMVNLHMMFPNFDSENDMLINNIKGQEYSARQVEQRNTDIVADAAFDYVRYGENSPYIKRPTLMEEVLPMTAAQLEGVLHQVQNYELEIHYAGALPALDVKNILYNKLSLNNNVRPTMSPVERPMVPITENKIYFLPDAEMQQAKVYFLIDGEPYNVKDAVNYMAFNEYFGGGFSGLVMNEIREKRSMAYTAYGYFSRPPKQGQMTKFVGYVGTQSDKVADAIDVYMSLLDSMPQYPETMENIRTVLRQSVLSNKPTFRNKSQRLTANMLMGYKVDPAMLQVRDIQRLTFDNVLSFYQSRIQGKPITILIMGDPKLVNQKQIQSKYGKITKLSKSRLFSY